MNSSEVYVYFVLHEFENQNSQQKNCQNTPKGSLSLDKEPLAWSVLLTQVLIPVVSHHFFDTAYTFQSGWV